MRPSPIPKFDNPKMRPLNPALLLFGAGREKRIYAVPPYTPVKSLDFEDHPFDRRDVGQACALCGAQRRLPRRDRRRRQGRAHVRLLGHRLLRAASRSRRMSARAAARRAGPREALRRRARLPRRGLRSLAGRGARRRRRVGLGQDHRAQLLAGQLDADGGRHHVHDAATSGGGRAAPVGGGAAPARADRVGPRPPEPARRAAHGRERRRQRRRAR